MISITIFFGWHVSRMYTVGCLGVRSGGRYGRKSRGWRQPWMYKEKEERGQHIRPGGLF
jgi:hypothetical protein